MPRPLLFLAALAAVLLTGCPMDDEGGNTAPAYTPAPLAGAIAGNTGSGSIWYPDSIRYAINAGWQALPGSCYDDDRLHYRLTGSTGGTFSIGPGLVIGECSGCTTCYFTDGTWQVSDIDSLLIRFRPGNTAHDTLKVLGVNATFMAVQRPGDIVLYRRY